MSRTAFPTLRRLAIATAIVLAGVHPGPARAAEPLEAPAGGGAASSPAAEAPPPRATEAESVEAATAPERVAELVAEAIAKNPDIEAMRAHTHELGEMAAAAGVWNDPAFSVEYSNVPVDSFALDEFPMSGVQFKLQQRLPEWGWRGASKALAEGRVARSEYDRANAELELARSVEQLYWNLTLSRLLEDVTQRHLARTLELIRAVRARYEVGRVGQNALLRLDVLRQRLADDLDDFGRAQRTLAAALARALARQADETFSTPPEVTAVAPEGDLARWLEQARNESPRLAALREEVALQTDTATLSRTRALPEVDVWVAYRLRTIDTAMDDGTDFLSVGVSVPIPLGSRKMALRGEAAGLAARDGARARLAAELDRIEADLISADAAWARAADKAGRYASSLIPAAHAALQTTLNDFSVDRAEFSTLYEAEIDLLTLERAYLSAAIETHLQRATVRALTGRGDAGGAS